MQRLSSPTDLACHDTENPGRKAGVFVWAFYLPFSVIGSGVRTYAQDAAMIRNATSLLLVLCAGLLLPASARADGPADCERQGVAFAKRQGGTISRIQIDKGDRLVVNRFDDKVGSQMVATEYMGFARVTRPEGTKRQRFVCLHEGDGKRALYFGLLFE